MWLGALNSASQKSATTHRHPGEGEIFNSSVFYYFLLHSFDRSWRPRSSFVPRSFFRASHARFGSAELHRLLLFSFPFVYSMVAAYIVFSIQLRVYTSPMQCGWLVFIGDSVRLLPSENVKQWIMVADAIDTDNTILWFNANGRRSRAETQENHFNWVRQSQSISYQCSV